MMASMLQEKLYGPLVYIYSFCSFFLRSNAEQLLTNEFQQQNSGTLT